MIAQKRTMPAPAVDPETQEFWAAIEEKRLLIRYCNACDAPHYYPRTICPHCGSDDTIFKEASGKGSIYSYSVMRRVPVPYAIAYVTLEGTDISMMTNIVDCDLDALHVGQDVRVVFSETEGEGPPLPTFTPV